MLGVGEIRGRLCGVEVIPMFCKITTCEDGVLRTYVGHVESWDASTVRLLLTEPFALAGRFVDLDVAQVVEHLVLATPR